MTVEMRRNRGRVLVVDAPAQAHHYRRVFMAKKPRQEEELPFSWPRMLRAVGDSLGVAYASDKWQEDGDYDLYLHLAEKDSRNRVVVARGFLPPSRLDGAPLKPIGPFVDFDGVPMPRQFAKLAYFEEARLLLHTGGTDAAPEFGPNEDDGVVAVWVRHAFLGGAQIQWSAVGKGKDEPFLFVYTEPRGSDPGGVGMIVRGEKLDIEKDGIVG